MTMETPLLSCEDVEIAKIPGAWILTWWLPDNSATLRLKVSHTSYLDPDFCVAQVKLRPEEEFQSIGEFRTTAYDLLYPEESDNRWCDDLPDIWTAEFKALVEVWGRLQANVEFGPTVCSRYSGEAASSLDYIYCEAHDIPITTAKKTDGN